MITPLPLPLLSPNHETITITCECDQLLLQKFLINYSITNNKTTNITY